VSGSKGLSEQAQRIACECHNLDVLHLQNAPEYCDNADPNGCGGRFNKEDCEIYQSAHRIDAALRAAKVEELERVQSRFRKDGIALTLIYLQYRIAELGRSAQIEEGE